jgi:hypothetical protein
LDVNLRLDSSVTAAELEYSDACRQPKKLAIGDRVKQALTREVGQVFNKVRIVEGNAVGELPDGQVTVVLGLKTVDTFIPTKRRGNHAAIVTLGATTAFFDASGNELFGKNIRVETKGEVETDGERCEVSGVPDLVNQAIATLAHGIKKNLGMAVPIQRLASEAPAQRRQGGQAGLPPKPSQVQPGGEPEARLTVRAMVEDANRDHVFQGGEDVVLRVEVTNSGEGRVKAVTVGLGSPSLWSQPPVGTVLLGELAPGETKRAEFAGRVKAVMVPEQADLSISVRGGAGGLPVGEERIIPVSLRPSTGFLNEPVVDVDQIPGGVSGYMRRKAAAIAIGVESFRDARLTGLPYAAQDAVVTAHYWRNVGGIPDSQIRVLTNDRAAKDDWANVFEEWLPGHVEPGGTVMVFLAGRIHVDAAGTAASFLTHDAQAGGSAGLFSVRRLTADLARLPIQQAIVFVDVAPLESRAGGSDGSPVSDWFGGTGGSEPGKVIMVFGSSRGQRSHALDHARHGVFAYWMLRGLGGEADENRDGNVLLGELYDWVRRKVPEMARRLDGQEQVPVSEPALARGSKAHDILMTKTK